MAVPVNCNVIKDSQRKLGFSRGKQNKTHKQNSNNNKNHFLKEMLHISTEVKNER